MEYLAISSNNTLFKTLQVTKLSQVIFLTVWMLLFASLNVQASGDTPDLYIAQTPNTQENQPPNLNTDSQIKQYTLEKAIEIQRKDGSQNIVPAITGEIFWWLIFTTLVGTLIAIIGIIAGSVFYDRKLNQNGKNPYITEMFPTFVQGLTIVYIVLAVLLLAIFGIASAEGALSILAGISGYVLGKGQEAKKSRDKNNTIED